MFFQLEANGSISDDGDVWRKSHFTNRTTQAVLILEVFCFLLCTFFVNSMFVCFTYLFMWHVCLLSINALNSRHFSLSGNNKSKCFLGLSLLIKQKYQTFPGGSHVKMSFHSFSYSFYCKFNILLSLNYWSDKTSNMNISILHCKNSSTKNKPNVHKNNQLFCIKWKTCQWGHFAQLEFLKLVQKWHNGP